MGYAPENTLASIRKALDLGVDFIEIDVQCVDGQLVVFHDDTLERTTNGTGRLVDKSFDELRALNAGNGERIPTLDEVCALTHQQCGLNIELKNTGTAKPVAVKIDQLRSEGWPDELFLVSSFHRDELLQLSASDAAINIGLLVERLSQDDMAFAKQIHAGSIHVEREGVSKEWIERIHNEGMKVYVYTVNHADEMLTLRNIGIDGVFTNYPDKVCCE